MLNEPPLTMIFPPVDVPAAAFFPALSKMALAVAFVVETAPVRVRSPVNVAISINPSTLIELRVIVSLSTIETLFPDATDIAPEKLLFTLVSVILLPAPADMLVVPFTVIWPGSLIIPLALMVRLPPTWSAGDPASCSMVETALILTSPLPVVLSVPTHVLPDMDCCVTVPVPVVERVER